MRRYVSTLVVVAMLVVVPGALAGSSLLSAYGAAGSKPTVQVKGATAGGKTVTNGPSKLPFTGVDLAVLVGAGFVLVVSGLGIRRLTGAKE